MLQISYRSFFSQIELILQLREKNHNIKDLRNNLNYRIGNKVQVNCVSIQES